MNTLEERVRAATRAAAGTVAPDSVPPLRLPSGEPGRPRGGTRSSAPTWSVWARRLAPLAAAMAVVALAVAIVNLSNTVRYAPAPGSRPAAPGGMTVGPSLASYVAAGLVPRYFVSIEAHGNPRSNPPSYAVVRSTATGSALGTVLPPAAGGTIVAATAAAGDQTFVLQEQPRASSGAGQSLEPSTFYLFRLGASGHPGAPTRLPMSVPRGALVTGLALSPDGSQLAMAVQPDFGKAGPGPQQIRVYSLSTGMVRTWSATNGSIDAGPYDVGSLSWTADERTLALDWQNSQGVLVVRLLNLRTGGGNLLADSRQVSPVNQGPGGATPGPASGPQPTCQDDWVITPDGTTIVCGANRSINVSVSSPGKGGLRRGAETEFREYSVATGVVTRILGHWTFGDVGVLTADVLWSDASGSVLIGVIPDAGPGRVGVIRENEFTPLRASPDSVSPYDNTW